MPWFASATTAHDQDFTLFVQVYIMYIGLLLSALNKLPLKLPQNSAGRRHNQKSSTSESITFDDVAGVDEAKEELAEVVVSNSTQPSSKAESYVYAMHQQF